MSRKVIQGSILLFFHMTFVLSSVFLLHSCLSVTQMSPRAPCKKILLHFLLEVSNQRFLSIRYSISACLWLIRKLKIAHSQQQFTFSCFQTNGTAHVHHQPQDLPSNKAILWSFCTHRFSNPYNIKKPLVFKQETKTLGN